MYVDVYDLSVNANWVFNFLKCADDDNYKEGACAIQLLVNTANAPSMDRTTFQH